MASVRFVLMLVVGFPAPALDPPCPTALVLSPTLTPSFAAPALAATLTALVFRPPLRMRRRSIIRLCIAAVTIAFVGAIAFVVANGHMTHLMHYGKGCVPSRPFCKWMHFVCQRVRGAKGAAGERLNGLLHSDELLLLLLSYPTPILCVPARVTILQTDYFHICHLVGFESSYYPSLSYEVG